MTLIQNYYLLFKCIFSVPTIDAKNESNSSNMVTDDDVMFNRIDDVFSSEEDPFSACADDSIEDRDYVPNSDESITTESSNYDDNLALPNYTNVKTSSFEPNFLSSIVLLNLNIL